MNSEALENLEKKFEQHLRSVGMKRTRQKSTILRVFLRITKPVSAMELLYPVKQEDIGCSFGTVYHTLRLLVACGIATEIVSLGDATRYALRQPLKSVATSIWSAKTAARWSRWEERLQDRRNRGEAFPGATG